MKMKITLHGVAYEVEVEILDGDEGYGTLSGIPPVARFVQSQPMPTNQSNDGILPPPSRAAAAAAAAAAANAGGKTIISPVGGTIVEVKAKAGDAVKVAAGDTVRESQVLVEFQ